MSAKKKTKPDAFTESDKHVLDGVKLFPWTPARVIAGQAMGMLYPRIGKDGWDQYRRTKVYPGALKDVVICLWLCTQSNDQVDEADAAPIEAYKQARGWAASLGIHKIDSDQFWQAYGKFVDVMNDVNESSTVPKIEGDDGTDEGND